MSMWPSKININQNDGVLSECATQDEILNALLLWDVPLEAYPKEILSAKLVWYVQQPGADGIHITVDLHLQAFVVPHNGGHYYSFWNKDELPLGNFTLPLKNKKGQVCDRLQPYISHIGLGACQTGVGLGTLSNGIALAYIPGFQPASQSRNPGAWEIIIS